MHSSGSCVGSLERDKSEATALAILIPHHASTDNLTELAEMGEKTVGVYLRI
jgi:hypothetical protein